MADTKKTVSKAQKLACINAILVVIALILSMVSSGKAYALSHPEMVVVPCIIAIVLDLLVFLLDGKIPGAVRDLMLFACIALTAFAMCTLISGRVLLAGYIYFSDLEANNPVAVSAMNLSLAAIAFYVLAVIMNLINGFARHEKD